MIKTESDKDVSPLVSNPFTLQRQHTMGEQVEECKEKEEENPTFLLQAMNNTKNKTEDELNTSTKSIIGEEEVRNQVKTKVRQQSPPFTKEECAFEEGIKRMKSSGKSTGDDEEEDEKTNMKGSKYDVDGPILLQRQWTFSHDIPDEDDNNQEKEDRKIHIKTSLTTPEPPPLLRLNSLSDDDCLGKTPRGFFGSEGDIRNLQGLESIKMEHLFSPPSIPTETTTGNLILQRQDSWADDVSDSSWRAW